MLNIVILQSSIALHRLMRPVRSDDFYKNQMDLKSFLNKKTYYGSSARITKPCPICFSNVFIKRMFRSFDSQMFVAHFLFEEGECDKLQRNILFVPRQWAFVLALLFLLLFICFDAHIIARGREILRSGPPILYYDQP